MNKVSAIQLNSGPNIKVNLYDVKSYVEQISDTDSKMVSRRAFGPLGRRLGHLKFNPTYNFIIHE